MFGDCVRGWMYIEVFIGRDLGSHSKWVEILLLQLTSTLDGIKTGGKGDTSFAFWERQ